jgi:hypothetical protein
MKKDEIIWIIENLPSDIDGYKLSIYENRVFEPWGFICKQGNLNKKKLIDIFDGEGEIKHYYFDNNLEFQFSVIYEKNEQMLFGTKCFGSLTDCLKTVLIKITEYKNKKGTPKLYTAYIEGETDYRKTKSFF